VFDTMADVPHVGVALGVVGLTLLGVVTALPAEPTPDANAVGETVDRVAASAHPTMATHPLTADAVKLGPRGVSLRSEGGTSHADFAYGPVTPVTGDGPLRRVLRGVPPDQVFDSPRAFERAAATARRADPVWREGGDRLHLRHLSWGDVRVTLVGA
jgi:hypothetical protein